MAHFEEQVVSYEVAHADEACLFRFFSWRPFLIVGGLGHVASRMETWAADLSNEQTVERQ